MAEFTAEVFQNEFLPDGATDVHAVVAITCTGAGEAGKGSGGDAAEVIIIDTSGSMQGSKISAAQQAAAIAIDQILDGTWFAVVAGTDGATRVYPAPYIEAAMVRMDAQNRAQAKAAVSRLVAGGGTAMGTWLRLATRLFAGIETSGPRHAVLLTDGQNQSETAASLAAAISDATGAFQCDCRGIGRDWEVSELRQIGSALLGSVEVIPGPQQLAEEFRKLVQQAMARGVADSQLRVWAPQGAQVLFVKQVHPEVHDLTSRRTVVNALTGAYPTGSWSDESREYQVAVRLPARTVGAEQLGARLQLVVGDQTVAQGLVKALWTADEALTARINPVVAHYTGQAELAQVIQEGLAAKSAGDEATATVKLGRAVQLAEETGNGEATTRLKKLVEVEDAGTGRVRLKGKVDKLDEMMLDTASTKTTRVHK
jgi:hypothetical protein